MQFKSITKKRTTINVTPLIDVLFILLIFFMVSSSFIEQPGVKLELPTIKSRESTRVENLVVHVSKEGEIFLGETQVELENLATALEELIPNAEEKTLILKADVATQHGTVVKVMDIAKQSGLTKIVFGSRVDQENGN